MNMTMTARQTKGLAAGLAVALTLTVMGGQLSLAEHYAQSGAASYPTGYSQAQRTRLASRTICPSNEQPTARTLPARSDVTNAHANKSA